MVQEEMSANNNIEFLNNVGVETEGKNSAYLITFTPYFRKTVKREMRDLDQSVKFERNISDSIALITSEQSQGDLIQNIFEKPTIFIKHIMPVMSAGEIDGSLDSDKVKLLDAVERVTRMENKSKFAVQCRVTNSRLPYSAKDIEVYIGNSYYDKGYIPSFSDREIMNEDIYIISILLHESNFYIGFSKSNENLNFHSDEHRVCSRTGREISRAENKLKEALSTFKVELEGHGTALDLGAAPGGWSKVLADYGYNVLAVDPANLHPQLENDPRIEHLRVKSQDLAIDTPLDLLVNDMNMDPQETAEIINEVAHLLKENGLAIVTFKLPNRPQQSIEETVQIIRKEYDVIAIRSLFHNRQEVTALLKKKKKKNKLQM